MIDFNIAFELIVAKEGGYNNNPSDSGGETNYGISKASYPDLDIKNLSFIQAKKIYFNDYWIKGQCQLLPSRLSVYYFDACINHGIEIAIEILQNFLGVSVDGNIGPNTKSAIQNIEDENDYKFLSLRALYYSKLSTYKIFGKGWLNRLFELSQQVNTLTK